jgi:hypothetical protein
MPRFFTLEQAEKLLPAVEAAIREAIALQSEYQEADAEREDFSRRVAMLGGMRVDRAQVTEHANRREAIAERFKHAIEKIHELGCLVKDLNTGLVDFPTLLDGEEVYLCWRLGEPGIRFWHGVHEGFRGRKPIDQKFLQHHQGELPN